jgi:hypothetical protein
MGEAIALADYMIVNDDGIESLGPAFEEIVRRVKDG